MIAAVWNPDLRSYMAYFMDAFMALSRSRALKVASAAKIRRLSPTAAFYLAVKGASLTCAASDFLLHGPYPRVPHIYSAPWPPGMAGIFSPWPSRRRGESDPIQPPCRGFPSAIRYSPKQRSSEQPAASYKTRPWYRRSGLTAGSSTCATAWRISSWRAFASSAPS